MTTYPANEDHTSHLQPPTEHAMASALMPWLIRLPVLFITGVILLVLVLVFLIAAFRMSYDDKITPGVSAFGLDLSGMTRDEAISALSTRFTYDNTAIFTFRHEDRYWQLTAQDLGFTSDLAETVDRALTIGKGGDIVSGLLDQARAWFDGYVIVPIIHYDQNTAAERIAAIAIEIDTPSQDASLYISGAKVMTTPGHSGWVLDVMTTLAHLDRAMLSLTAGAEVALVVTELPPAICNVDEAANLIRAALSGPLELVADGPNGERLGPWSISVEQIAALLAIEMVDGSNGARGYQVNIDMNVFADSLNSLAPGLITPPRSGRFHFDDNTRELEIVLPAVNGRELNVEETLARLEQAVFRYDGRSVPIAFNYIESRYHNAITAAELGITEMVAEATTYYNGSGTNRRHNIAEGASRFNGLIIGPGEEFSFNFWLGDVSIEAGFVESKVIEGERTVDGVGGGICQVSTTAFRAAFTGGFTIIERNSHAYRVGFYELNNSPPGLDAAIWTPDRDLRFQNDTPYHLLIETSVYPANNALQFRFYGNNPGRTIEIQEPIIRNLEPALETVYESNAALQLGEAIQVDWAAEGADVTVLRVIRDAGGNELRRDSIFTHYFPWRAIIQVAPNDSRLVSGNS